MRRVSTYLFLVLILSAPAISRPPAFISARDGRLMADARPYYFLGTNYWYASLLPLEKDRARGINRLRRELDFLKAHGVTNLRLMAGAEGEGYLNGVIRVGPPLQPEPGKFNDRILYGLDVVLAEMKKRGMRAVIFFSNNWEWSGGFQQYLIWNHVISNAWLVRKPSWDELRNNVSKFYSCRPCVAAYHDQVVKVISRRNSVTGQLYINDATIMAWELANEPRPMRPAANDAYRKWIADTARLIKSHDRKHLVTTGHEGWIGTQGIKLFETIHDDPNIDYLTIHIWPKNWAWFEDGKLSAGFEGALAQTIKYVEDNVAVAVRLGKPLIIEEFGLPRDGQSFDPLSPTTYRDRYFASVLSFIGGQPGGHSHISGANFWAYGGRIRPIPGQHFWKPGDERLGDPPMEEQGLNSVFDSDRSTWSLLKRTSGKLRRLRNRL